MKNKIYKIINNIFYLNEGFNIIENNNGWININYWDEDFIVIYIDNKDKSIVVYHYYDYNSLEFINKYNIKKSNKSYIYMNINNKLKLLYERKIIQDGKMVDHLNLFNKLFNI